MGVFAFLLAVKTWREPELRGVEIATSGEAIVWAITALPVLFVFFVIDVVWLCVTVSWGRRSRDWRPLVVVMGVAAIWFGAALLDQLNH